MPTGGSGLFLYYARLGLRRAQWWPSVYDIVGRGAPLVLVKYTEGKVNGYLMVMSESEVNDGERGEPITPRERIVWVLSSAI